MIKAAKNIRDVVLNNSLVASILKSGGSSDDCIIAMHNQIQEMIKEAIEQYMITPKKIKLPDGKVMIWRCPEEFIPVYKNTSEED